MDTSQVLHLLSHSGNSKSSLFLFVHIYMLKYIKHGSEDKLMGPAQALPLFVVFRKTKSKTILTLINSFFFSGSLECKGLYFYISQTYIEAVLNFLHSFLQIHFLSFPRLLSASGGFRNRLH